MRPLGRGGLRRRGRQEERGVVVRDDRLAVHEAERPTGLDHGDADDLVPAGRQAADAAGEAVAEDAAGEQDVAVPEHVGPQPHQLAGVAVVHPGLHGLLPGDVHVLLAVRDLAERQLAEELRIVPGGVGVDDDDVDGLAATGHVAGHEAVEQRLRHCLDRESDLLFVQEMGHRVCASFCDRLVKRCEKRTIIIPYLNQEINIIGY